ncbi:MAG: helix-turn-helix transcriptional regulator [Halothiobacillaceae bacterium]
MSESDLLEKLDNIAVALKLGRPALWSLGDIAAYCGLSVATVRIELTSRADFPAPIKVTDDAKGRRWEPDEVIGWLKKRREALPKPRVKKL